MRLKEDSNNYRSSGLKNKIKATPETARFKSHKNTKRWCKGKPGKLHDYDLKDFNEMTWRPEIYRLMFIKFKCTACGKELLTTLQKDTACNKP